MKYQTLDFIQHFLAQGNTVYISHENMLILSEAFKSDNVTAFQIVPDNEPQFPDRPYAVIYSGILTDTNLKDYYRQKYEDEHQAYENLYTSVRDLLKDF